MAVLLRWLVLVGCCALILFGGGCKKLTFPKDTQTDKTGQKNNADIPGAVTGEGWNIHWKTPDPHHPGASLPVMDADAVRGELADTDNDDTILLHDVKAKLYRNGKLAANVVAPTMTASRRTKTVVGSDGVTLTSLTDPPDTVVTSDTMTWDVHTGKLVALGHAQVTRHPKKNELAITQNGNRIDFDTKLKDFVIH